MKTVIIATVLLLATTHAQAATCWVDKVYRHGTEMRVIFVRDHPDGVIIWHADKPKVGDELFNAQNRFSRSDGRGNTLGETYDGLPLKAGDKAYAYSGEDWVGCRLQAVVVKGKLGVRVSALLAPNDPGDTAPMIAFLPAAAKPHP